MGGEAAQEATARGRDELRRSTMLAVVPWLHRTASATQTSFCWAWWNVSRESVVALHPIDFAFV